MTCGGERDRTAGTEHRGQIGVMAGETAVRALMEQQCLVGGGASEEQGNSGARMTSGQNEKLLGTVFGVEFRIGRKC